ncbi:hypothetical protein [Paenarthrobacter ureafaciens]|uniref:hypothetical protein n=1 Tax=Paenarthrobacter ureafaciens TaxID=37931 RepID=UPI002DBF9367|nr:hypothetical protein [Paenarthrobacter ureafaciens]MEC3853457.1 hypothetical protein [Paenarthrobacter ureafaciens]
MKPSSSGKSLQDAAQELDADEDALYGILKEFWASGLADDIDRANVPSMNSVFPTGAGTAKAREIATASTNAGKRRLALRNGIVDWLSSVGEPSGLSDFVDDPRASFFGVPYTQDELSAAAEYLQDKEMVKGYAAWGGEILRPSLTSDGIDCADSYSADVQSYLNRSQTVANNTNVTVHGSTGVNIAANSNYVNQSVGISQETVNKIKKIVDSFQQARPLLELDAENDTKLTQVVADIQAEVDRPVPDTNKLKGFLQTLHSIGVGAAGDALGSVLGDAVMAVMGSF